MATEYKLPYTALDINRRLGKVDEIDSLKDLVGSEPVQKQISDAIKNIGESLKTDTTLKVRGAAADAKAVGDAIASAKVEIDKTLKVSGKAADAKVTGDEITKLNNLVGNIPVSEQITTAIDELEGNLYEHPDTHPASMITGLSSVAISGSYEDLTNVPEQVQPDWNQDDDTKADYIKNKPVIPEEYTHPETHPVSMITGLSDVATSGNYEDLTNKPNIPEAYEHPSTHPVDMITGLSGVAVSGDYNDLINKPDISGEYIHPESHPASMITGLANIATSGNYEDLSNKPTIPEAYVHPENHPASMIEGLASVATSGSYNDLTDKPSIPSIDGLATVAYVDEKFANVGGGGGESTGLPEFSSDDEGKVLSIKDGEVSWESIDKSTDTEVDIMPELVVENFAPNSSLGGLITSYRSFDESYTNYYIEPFIIELGGKYTVVWDDEIWEDVIAVEATLAGKIGLLLGNGTSAGLSGNGEPFAIAWQTNGVTFFSDDSTVTSHKIRIYQKVETTAGISWNDIADRPFYEDNNGVKYLDNKYLEFMTSEPDKVVVDETIDMKIYHSNDDNPDRSIYMKQDFVNYGKYSGLEVGEEYTVIWNDTEYVLTSVDASLLFMQIGATTVNKAVIIGNTALIDSSLPDTGDPFVLAAGDGFSGSEPLQAVITFAYANSSLGSEVDFTARIIQPGRAVIDPAYLPDNIGTDESGPALPEVTNADVGKFLRVGADGSWIVEAIQDVSEVGL